jgi:hypothetical protein
MGSHFCLCVCVCLCIPLIVTRQRLGKNPLIFARQRLGKHLPTVARQRLDKNPPILARQRLGINVTAVTYRNNIRIVGRVVFNVARVSRKVGDWFFPEGLVIINIWYVLFPFQV